MKIAAGLLPEGNPAPIVISGESGCAAVGITSPPHAGKYNTERYGIFVQAGYKFPALPEGFN